jgi:hypothetical protein
MPTLNAHPASREARPQVFAALKADPVHFCALSDIEQSSPPLEGRQFDWIDGVNLVETTEWTEDDVVQLHWRLLLELRRLPDPETPLEDKLDTLAWALTDPSLDDRPFSFANCLRVVGSSPLSPTPYFGALQVEDIRDWLRANARPWLRQTLCRYPDWVQDLVRRQPDWAARQLLLNPQWINEQINEHDQVDQPDLFGSAAPFLG